MNHFTLSPYLHNTVQIQSMFPHLTLHIKVELQGNSSQWTEKDVQGGGRDFIECIVLEFARMETYILLIQTRNIITGANCWAP
jgi:hypothetical protein